ncbi:MAG: hypothetical protein M1820_006187 [Bogoriella megaspora]|nr:MAG: hypothetical protein M1820_006187 [Bogoriella megaspora]
MDPLSITASVVAIIQFTGPVVQYLNDIKDAPKECRHSIIEVSNLNTLLLTLDNRVQESDPSRPWHAAVHALAVPGGPLSQYKQALGDLAARLQRRSAFGKIKMTLTWAFVKDEIERLIARIERLKSLITIAIESDHITLSKAIQEDTSKIATSLAPLQSSVQAMRTHQDLEWHESVMRWLSPINVSAQQQDILSRKQDDTGQWFLYSSRFETWKNSAQSTLYCPGIPGAGKTMIAAIAVHHMHNLVRNTDTGVASIYFNYKEQSTQSTSNALALLLKQLVNDRSDLAERVASLYEQCERGRDRPPLTELLTLLRTVSLKRKTIYVVVDALDECTESNGTRGQILGALRNLQQQMDLRLMFTSRFLSTTDSKFREIPSLEIRANGDDINKFVVGQLPRLPKCIQKDIEFSKLVQDKIVETVDGMFLLARFHVDSLLDKKTKRSVILALEQLNTGFDALEKAYNDAIIRIDGQLPDDRCLARRVISWITYAKRPLLTDELRHALAVNIGDKELDSENLLDTEDLAAFCAGLVTIDAKSKVIRLVHYTTQEFFERECSSWNPDAQKDIVSTSLTYLSFDTFRSYEKIRNRIEVYPFLGYAARYWGEHLRPVMGELSNQALCFLSTPDLLPNAMQALVSEDILLVGKWSRKRTTGLHMSIVLKLAYLIKALLQVEDQKNKISVNSKDRWDYTPLALATALNLEDIIRILLEESDIDVNAVDSHGHTPLHLAIFCGNKAVVRLLLQRDDIEVNRMDSARDGSTRLTPLGTAALNNSATLAEALLERNDVDANGAHNAKGDDLLFIAASYGSDSVVRMLLNRDDTKFKSDRKYAKKIIRVAKEAGPMVEARKATIALLEAKLKD